MLKMIDPSKAQELENQPPQFNVIRVSGPGFVTQSIIRYMLQFTKEKESKVEDSVLILPKHFFYPVSNQERKAMSTENYEELFSADYPVEEVYTCHLWHASWVN